jgi:hypothetical protein
MPVSCLPLEILTRIFPPMHRVSEYELLIQLGARVGNQFSSIHSIHPRLPHAERDCAEYPFTLDPPALFAC